MAVLAILGMACGPSGEPKATRPVADPNPPQAVCARALACSSQCYREARNPTQSLPECEDPGSKACTQALSAAAAPDLVLTLAAVQCVLECEPEHRSRADLREVDLAAWAALDIHERAAWAGIAAGRDCVPGAVCSQVCDQADFPAPGPVQAFDARRAEAAAKP